MQINSQHLAEVVDALRHAAASKGGSEKRRATRVEVRAKVKIAPYVQGFPGAETTVFLQDISYLGTGTIQPFPMANDAQFILRLPRTNKEELIVLCLAKYCRAMCDGVFLVGSEYERFMDAATLEKLRSAGADELKRIQSSVLG